MPHTGDDGGLHDETKTRKRVLEISKRHHGDVTDQDDGQNVVSKVSSKALTAGVCWKIDLFDTTHKQVIHLIKNHQVRFCTGYYWKFPLGTTLGVRALRLFVFV